jgi:hypothetical protein
MALSTPLAWRSANEARDAAKSGDAGAEIAGEAARIPWPMP